MADMVISDVSEETVRAIDAAAGRLGLTREEYLRRLVDREAATGRLAVTPEGLARFANRVAELDDAETMDAAWDRGSGAEASLIRAIEVLAAAPLVDRDDTWR